MTGLAAHFLRGLNKKKWIDLEQVTFEAFYEPSAPRSEDGGREISVNWEDDEHAVGFTLRSSTGVHGAARVELAEVENNLARVRESVIFERRTSELEPSNAYHGNIVYLKTVTKVRLKQIANVIALASEFIPNGHR